MSNEQDQVSKTNTPDFPSLEIAVLKHWDSQKIFEKSLEQTAGNQPYVFYDGPPFATGLPHHGHLLTSVIKDAIPRFQTMKGKFVRRKWGWDCHGLPIENIVEKKLGISGKKQIEELGVEKFNQACRENVWGYEAEWGKMVHRIGRWVDFQDSYKTMDTSFQESVWWALKQLWEKNLIYEDRKVLLYCARCETPISNFEVAMDNSYRDVTENSVVVKFKLEPRQRIVDWLTDEKTFVLAWTTTPWTLPGNTALNIGSNITYCLVEQQGNKYILAKDRLEILQGEFEVLREVSARSLEGLRYEPLFNGIFQDPNLLVGGDFQRAHKIYIEDFVTTVDGTGVVHNAAMYGEEDFQAAKRRDLPRVDMLNHQGHFLESAPEFVRGKFFKSADKLVLENLAQRDLAYSVISFTHSYPHCHRCATPLYYNALPSWFIRIQEIKQQLLKHNEDIRWVPEHIKHGRFQKSMEQAPDWNISRNRYWATALPFWKCASTDCKNVVCIGSVGELVSRSVNFSEVYPNFVVKKDGDVVSSNLQLTTYNLESLDLHRPYIDRVILKCDKCSGEMRRIEEVVDCWVESGSMPFAELHFPFEHTGTTGESDFKARFPADFVVEYTPQTRAWFYVMHVINSTIFGQAPFKNVLCHGTILAEDGSKMSKSKGNFTDPGVLIEKYGADAMRFALLSSSTVTGEDATFSETQVKEVSQKLNMLLYNMWSFYRLYTDKKFKIINGEQPPAKAVLDEWVLLKLNKLISDSENNLENFNTPRFCRDILDFIAELSTWYVRRSRERMKMGGPEAEDTLAVFGFVLARVAQVLAPAVPFLAEFIYRDVTGEESVHLSKWPAFEEVRDERPLVQMQVVREIVSSALSARKLAGISVRQPLESMAFKLKTDVPLSAEHLQLILEELNVRKIEDFDSLEELGRRKGGVTTTSGSGNVESTAIFTVLSLELKEEGFARELERAIQDLRKKSGLKVGEMAVLYYNIPDKSLVDILLQKVDRDKTFLSGIEHNLEVEVDFEAQVKVGDVVVWLGLSGQMAQE